MKKVGIQSHLKQLPSTWPVESLTFSEKATPTSLMDSVELVGTSFNSLRNAGFVLGMVSFLLD